MNEIIDMAKEAKRFDFILNTVAVPHDLDPVNHKIAASRRGQGKDRTGCDVG